MDTEVAGEARDGGRAPGLGATASGSGRKVEERAKMNVQYLQGAQCLPATLCRCSVSEGASELAKCFQAKGAATHPLWDLPLRSPAAGA